MKLGVSSYSFNQAIRAGRLGQYEAIDEAARLGYETIDFSVLTLDEDILSAAPKLRKRCEDAGIIPANYAVGADFLKNDWMREVERLKKELDAAAIIGVRTFRHDATSGFPPDAPGVHSFSRALPQLAEACRKIAEYGQSVGVKTMVENHGTFCQHSQCVEALALAVDHPNFGILLDIGNFACADECSVEAVARLAPYAFHVHAKDFHIKPYSERKPGVGWFNTRSGAWLRGAIIGHGDIPLGPCLTLIKKAGYDGPVAIEFEGVEDCIFALEDGRRNLAALLGMEA